MTHCHNRSRYRLGGATLEERIAGLRAVTAELQGQLMMYRRSLGKLLVLRVNYVLIKMEVEIERQLMDRAADMRECLQK